MKNHRMYKGWTIENGIGNAANLPQEYHHNIYADLENKRIYSGDTLSSGWDEYDHADVRIATVTHKHPYYGKPDYVTRDELVDFANAALTADSSK